MRRGPRSAAAATSALQISRGRTSVALKASPWNCRRWCRSSADVEIPSETPRKPCRPLAKSYDPNIVESGWFDWWQHQGFFTPKPHVRDRFTMLSPPPNVTGDLHIGHALTFSIQDAIARYRRMTGESVQWIPGLDHAGIATQSVVERRLWKEQKLTKHDLGRANFVDCIWHWKETHGGRIMNQLSSLGASLDFSASYFTMDAPRSDAVRRAFVRLHEQGLLYRDSRIVNWCCSLGTVISDEEVEYEDVGGRTYLEIPGRSEKVEFGVLHFVAYPLALEKDQDMTEGELVVGTTRLETTFGDVALAIHPDDPRYTHLHGRHVLHPLSRRRIPIVCDAELVDMKFGSGVVKVTPAHDVNDFQCGRRHNLPIRSVINKDGTISADCGLDIFVGKDRFEVRREIVAQLSDAGLYRGRANDHKMRLARCSKSGDIVEPLVIPQWYIQCDKLAANVIRAIDTGELHFHPEFHSVILRKILEDVERWPWCVSRQLWWGHRIPAYRLEFDTPPGARGHRLQDSKGNDVWFVAVDESAARIKADAYLQGKFSGSYKLLQDEDVLDTWFSSGLLPLTALGWTIDKPIPTRYPTALLETGSDILFFWAARMAMLCAHFSGAMPFSNLQFHGMVRDSQGRKMSKSLGNVLDPLHIIQGVKLDTLKGNIERSNLNPAEIKKSLKGLMKEFPEGIKACGADSLRFALCSYAKEHHVINMKIERVYLARQFCIKLWNLVKYSVMQMQSASYRVPEGGPFSQLRHLEGHDLALADRYVMSNLARTVDTCTSALRAGNVGVAADAVEDFVKERLCDVYVEFSKTVFYGGQTLERRVQTLHVLGLCVDVCLRLLHPIMPFITEELWQHLKQVAVGEEVSSQASIMMEKFPTTQLFSGWKSPQDESHMQTVLSILHAARSLRADNGYKQAVPLTIVLDANSPGSELNEAAVIAIENNLEAVQKLGRVSRWEVVKGSGAGKSENVKSADVSPGITLHLDPALCCGDEECAALSRD